jgi:WD40 repeat protein
MSLSVLIFSRSGKIGSRAPCATPPLLLRLLFVVLACLMSGCGGVPEECGDLYLLTSLAASPDGKTVAAGYQVGLREGIPVFSPGDSYLSNVECVSSEGVPVGELRLFDAQTGRRTLVLSGLATGVTRVSIAPDGKTVLVVADETRLYDSNTGAVKQTLPAGAPKISNAAFSPDGTALAVTRGSEIHLLNTETGQTLARLEGHTDAVTSLSYSGDGTMLASGSLDKTVRLWDVPAGRLRHTLSGHSDIVRSVAFSPDNSYVVSGGNDKVARHWDVPTGALVRTLVRTLVPHLDIITSVAISPDGTTIASGSWDGTAKLSNAQTGGLVATLEGMGKVVDLSFLRDSNTLVTAAARVKVWNSRTGQVLEELR